VELPVAADGARRLAVADLGFDGTVAVLDLIQLWQGPTALGDGHGLPSRLKMN
jgi:hypothetical protein